MTKDKFRALCEQVLIPRVGDILHHALVDMHETLDVIARELQRIGDRVDDLAADLSAKESHEEDY